jgi:septum formation protein
MDGKVYGKPVDADDARRMLRDLSGHTHTVITGVTITTSEHSKSFAVSTQVTFASLSDDEIDYYISNYKPFDKAGAYGIQEWIGYIGIEKIVGSYFNVMGLPVKRLYDELKTFIETL